MIKIIFSFALLIAGMNAFGQGRRADLKVVISDVRHEHGALLVSLFNNETGFPADTRKMFRKERAVVRNGEAVIVFSNLPPGKYAIAALHDENNNKKLDTRLGMPKEGYGFSNNAKGFMGPPSYDKASFNFRVAATVTIKMKY